MKTNCFVALLLFIGFSLHAEIKNDQPQDTIQSLFLNEVIISSSTKETNELKSLPGAASVITPQMIEGQKIISIKNLSMIVPNLYMYDYGSKLSTPAYIRGIGERSSGQSIGIYVDNLPYLDKSLFDFDLIDIQRIEVLRGPQGTLYGRNAMNGIVNIFTNSPFNEQTKISLTGGNYGLFRAKGILSRALSDNVAVSLSGYYDGHDGYFTNIFNDKKADKLSSAGGRFRLDWKISPNWTAQWNLNYDYNDQGAFPYGEYNDETEKISSPNQDYIGFYQRETVSGSMNLKYSNEQIIFNSSTGYVFLRDNMNMDIDYSPSNIFQLAQKQNESSWTEELTIKSNNKESSYQWTFGAFGFYNNLRTTSHTTLEKGAIETILQPVFDHLHATTSMPATTITDERIPIPGVYRTPSWGGAIFHQSTYNNLFTEGLSVTAGVRLDYEKTKMDYQTNLEMNMDMKMPFPPFSIVPQTADTTLAGKEKMSFTEILPKVAIKYEFNPEHYIYGTVTNGYKTGGYNVQVFADVAQAAIMEKYSGNDPVPVSEAVPYKPEYSWNYEIGYKGALIKDRLYGEITAFLINVKDIQITDFVESGQGRMLKNAGRARSVGAELSLTAILTNELRLILNYGFTQAEFTDYKLKENDIVIKDYEGNYIPFSPQNTFSVNAIYNKHFQNQWINGFNIQAQYNGAGKIYWTEENDVSQNFYGILNLKAGINKGKYNLSFWTQNTLDTEYTAFYFESMGKALAQRGRPFTCGVDLSVAF